MTTLLNVDVNTWKHKELYEHYKDYDNPYFTLCTQLDVTSLVSIINNRHYPFSLCLVYLSLVTANQHDSFRYRILGNRVVLHPHIHAAMTVLRENDRFNFCYLEYNADFFQFLACASGELEENMETDQSSNPVASDDDVIHFSMLPWTNFSNLSTARDNSDSVPKIVFGKYNEDQGRLQLPVAIEVNHALMDGIHVARYLEDFQDVLNRPQAYLRMAAEFQTQAISA